MHTFFQFGIRFGVLLGLSQAGVVFAESADAFRTEWRRAKPQAEFILEKMQVSSLLPETSDEVVAYLSRMTGNQTRFQVLRNELKSSPIEFVEVTPTNPDGHNPGNHCVHTDPRAGSPFKVSKTDCGTLKPSQIAELLIKATVIHLNDTTDELADYVTLAITDSYQRRIQSDPSFALFNRYKTAGTAPVYLYLDLPRRKLIRLGGAFSFSFSSLPALEGENGSFRTLGIYDRYGYDTWMEGVGKDPSGKIGWGEIDNTRRHHSYPLTVKVELRLVDNKTISISGSYETKNTNDQEPGKFKYFHYTMEYYPPTAEEIEAARLLSNTEALKTILTAGATPLSAADLARAEGYLRAGVQPAELPQFLSAALGRRAWSLVTLILPGLPVELRLDGEFFKFLASGDEAAVRWALTSKDFRSHLSLNAMVNHESAVGTVIKAGYSSLAHFWTHEKQTAQLLELLFQYGYDPKAATTQISNVPRSALSSAVARFRISPEIVNVILNRLDKETILQPDERDRTAFDYLVVHWNYLKKHCAAPSAQDPEAKAHYDRLLQRFQDVYAALIAKGHDGKRRGCLYAQIIQNRPSCIWKPKEKEFGIYFQSDYQPLPLGERPGNFYGVYWPEECL